MYDFAPLLPSAAYLIFPPAVLSHPLVVYSASRALSSQYVSLPKNPSAPQENECILFVDGVSFVLSFDRAHVCGCGGLRKHRVCRKLEWLQ